MKILILFFLSCLLISCSDAVTQQPFDFEKAEGIWVPFEIEYEDGTIFTEELAIFDIFAPYAGCFKLNADQTYSPLLWSEGVDYSKLMGSGICTYSVSTKKMTFSGDWVIEFDLIKFKKNELWLKNSSNLYKFERK